MTHFKHEGIKYVNTSEARSYVAQQKAMRKYHKIQSTKSFFKKLAKRMIILGLIAGAIFAFYEYTRLNSTTLKIEIQEKEVLIDNLGPKIDELKSEVLDTLQKCESQGANESDGLIVFDSNGKASIGLYQFQKKTVIYYVKTLYGKDITGKEAIELALDREEARKLAGDIIFQVEGGIDNWYNCKNKKGLAENIKWINKISK